MFATSNNNSSDKCADASRDAVKHFDVSKDAEYILSMLCPTNETESNGLLKFTSIMKRLNVPESLAKNYIRRMVNSKDPDFVFENQRWKTNIRRCMDAIHYFYETLRVRNELPPSLAIFRDAWDRSGCALAAGEVSVVNWVVDRIAKRVNNINAAAYREQYKSLMGACLVPQNYLDQEVALLMATRESLKQCQFITTKYQQCRCKATVSSMFCARHILVVTSQKDEESDESLTKAQKQENLRKAREEFKKKLQEEKQKEKEQKAKARQEKQKEKAEKKKQQAEERLKRQLLREERNAIVEKQPCEDAIPQPKKQKTKRKQKTLEENTESTKPKDDAEIAPKPKRTRQQKQPKTPSRQKKTETDKENVTRDDSFENSKKNLVPTEASQDSQLPAHPVLSPVGGFMTPEHVDFAAVFRQEELYKSRFGESPVLSQ